MTSKPLVRRTFATLRSAEFGFLGVVVYTRVQTPRFCGEPASAGTFDLARLATRPLRTNWLTVGMFLRIQKRTGRPRLLLRGRPGAQKRGRIIKRKLARCKKTGTAISLCVRFRNEAESPGHFGPLQAGQLLAGIGEPCEITVIEHAHALLGADQHRSLVVE